ncbi:unnamed protein product [Tuwongella immobilis]|uniref:Uncharacterized protein n=1 Tax=Tuwongella immobilis TaxID=692036 RepID=A0A6C2YVP0_9BACT|nr:unnamed protein product [Tuwongella immobilis]VTS08258.1 unnamed protein product [Tuwongella immobilis]
MPGMGYEPRRNLPRDWAALPSLHFRSSHPRPPGETEPNHASVRIIRSSVGTCRRIFQKKVKILERPTHVGPFSSVGAIPQAPQGVNTE